MVLPVGEILTLSLIEGIHVSMHRKYCKTEAEWMNQQAGMTYDRESNVE
tara:strand:- start:534 stop:680 length:147 start_codon:yes stop_codon:yes gene_type:complete